MSESKLVTILLVDTKVGLLNFLKVWKQCYNFTFDFIYTTPEKLQARLPYMDGEIHIVIVARTLVKWGVLTLVPLLEFVEGMEHINVSVLSTVNLEDEGLTFPALQIVGGGIAKLTGSKKAFNLFSKTLRACSKHNGSSSLVKNEYIDKLLYVEKERQINLTNIDDDLDKELQELGIFDSFIS